MGYTLEKMPSTWFWGLLVSMPQAGEVLASQFWAVELLPWCRLGSRTAQLRQDKSLQPTLSDWLVVQYHSLLCQALPINTQHWVLLVQMAPVEELLVEFWAFWKSFLKTFFCDCVCAVMQCRRISAEIAGLSGLTGRGSCWLLLGRLPMDLCLAPCSGVDDPGSQDSESSRTAGCGHCDRVVVCVNTALTWSSLSPASAVYLHPPVRISLSLSPRIFKWGKNTRNTQWIFKNDDYVIMYQ